MKTNLTELVFILDRSGSMAGLESDTIGGYNALLQKQQTEPGEAVVTTVLFNDEYQLLHDRINIKGIRPITEQEYFVGGTTALLDAIGRTIHKISSAQEHTSPEYRAGKVLFVIITDGMENSSREYSYDKIKQMIEKQTDQHGWEFIFLGANIDAIAAAAGLGISADRAANYHADSQGTQLNYEAVSCAVSELRQNYKLSSKWKASIDEDFKKRSKNGKKVH